MSGVCANRLPRMVANAFARAKVWAAVVLGLQILIFLLAVAAAGAPTHAKGIGLASLLVVFLSPYVNWFASRLKGGAEGVKRQQELLDGFGIEPSKIALRDYAVRFGKGASEQEFSVLAEGLRFESSEPTGARRAMENLRESAWFSKTLLNFCIGGLTLLAAAVLVTSVWLLLAVAQLPSTTNPAFVGQIVSLTLGFALSIGIVRNTLSFCSFKAAATSAEAAAEDLLQGAEIDERKAIRALMDYQYARATAPMIPTWLWRIKKDELNAAYADR